MPAGPSKTNVSEQNRTEFTYKWKTAEFGRFCCGKPWNFANWPVELGKIFHGKQWALPITCHDFVFDSCTVLAKLINLTYTLRTLSAPYLVREKWGRIWGSTDDLVGFCPCLSYFWTAISNNLATHYRQSPTVQ